MVIINYHNIIDKPPNTFNKLVRTWDKKKNFEQQIHQLSERFRIIPLDDMVQTIQSGKCITNACAITFDDGYLGAYKYGLPVLEKFGFPATFFLITRKIHQADKNNWEYFDLVEAMLQLTTKDTLDLTDFDFGMVSLTDDSCKIDFMKKFKKKIKVTSASEKNRINESIRQQLEISQEQIVGYLQHEAYQMMTWEQCEDLLKRGFTIGSHTRTHPSLSQIDNTQLDFEIRGSFLDLRERLDLHEIPFAYPYGKAAHFSKTAIAIVQRAGYTCALTTIKEANTPMSDIFQLGRFTFKDLKKRRTGLFKYPFRYSKIQLSRIPSTSYKPCEEKST
jgi:peptidoglycan/xylan/chitin deacetylase (PgdA/CDA1 family)